MRRWRVEISIAQPCRNGPAACRNIPVTQTGQPRQTAMGCSRDKLLWPPRSYTTARCLAGGEWRDPLIAHIPASGSRRRNLAASLRGHSDSPLALRTATAKVTMPMLRPHERLVWTPGTFHVNNAKQCSLQPSVTRRARATRGRPSADPASAAERPKRTPNASTTR